jgi:hypothetical protein
MGQPDCTRFLAKPKATLSIYPTFPNRDRGDDWRPSLIDGRDQDPTGTEGESTPRALRDPGWLVDLYEKNEWKCCGRAFDCLEVLARADMKGPWMIRPIPRENRADLYTAKRDARWNAQATYYEEQRKKQEEAERDARAFMNSARRGSDNAAARYEAAAPAQHRRGSNGSLGSILAKKGPRISITSIASDQTSTTLPMSATHTQGRPGRTRAKLSRAIFQPHQINRSTMQA